MCGGSSQHNQRLAHLSIPKFTSQSDLHSPHPHTDAIFLVLFFIFILGEAGVIFCGFYFGDVERILGNYDCYGNVCNRPQNRKLINHSLSGISTAGRPYVFQTRVAYWKWSTPLCVKSCPNETLPSMLSVKNYSENYDNPLCVYDVPISDYLSPEITDTDSIVQWSSAFADRTCPFLPVPRQLPLAGYCVVQDDFMSARNISVINHWIKTNQIAGLDRLRPIWEALLRDLLLVRWELVALALATLLLALLLVISIRYFSVIVQHVIIVLALLSITLFIGLIWLIFYWQQDILDTRTKERGLLYVEMINERGIQVIAIAASALALCLLVTIFVSLRAFKALNPLLKVCSSTMKELNTLILLPIMSLFCLALFSYYWLMALGYIITIANVKQSKQTNCVEFVSHFCVPFLFAYHLVALFWIADFIVSCQQFVNSALIMEWYFSRGKLNYPICSQFYWIVRVFCCHVGTVALSSFPTLPMRIMKFFVIVFRACCVCRNNHHTNQDMTSANKRTGLPVEQFDEDFLLQHGVRDLRGNAVHKCERKRAAGCCSRMFDACRVNNRAAFIICASESQGYCVSASVAYHVLDGHVSEHIVSLNAMMSFLFLLAKVTVSTIAMTLALVLLLNRQTIYCYVLPILVVAVLSFFITRCLLSIYETTIDCLLMCRCMESHEECTKGWDYVVEDWVFQTKLANSISKACSRLNTANGNKPINQGLTLQNELMLIREDRRDVPSGNTLTTPTDIPTSSFIPPTEHPLLTSEKDNSL